MTYFKKTFKDNCCLSYKGHLLRGYGSFKGFVFSTSINIEF
jgi:hypothetical protein